MDVLSINEEAEEEEQTAFDATKLPAVQPDKYTKCPYFPEHELRVSRLPYHLLKCQNAPNAPKLLACPYNYLHRVKPEDQREHILVCEDRAMVKYNERNPPSYANTRRQILMRGGHKSRMRLATQPDAPGTSIGANEEEQW